MMKIFSSIYFTRTLFVISYITGVALVLNNEKELGLTFIVSSVILLSYSVSKPKATNNDLQNDQNLQVSEKQSTVIYRNQSQFRILGVITTVVSATMLFVLFSENTLLSFTQIAGLTTLSIAGLILCFIPIKNRFTHSFNTESDGQVNSISEEDHQLMLSYVKKNKIKQFKSDEATLQFKNKINVLDRLTLIILLAFSTVILFLIGQRLVVNDISSIHFIVLLTVLTIMGYTSYFIASILLNHFSKYGDLYLVDQKSKTILFDENELSIFSFKKATIPFDFINQIKFTSQHKIERGRKGKKFNCYYYKIEIQLKQMKKNVWKTAMLIAAIDEPSFEKEKFVYLVAKKSAILMNKELQVQDNC